MHELTITKNAGMIVRTSVPIPIALWKRARAVRSPKQLQKVILAGLEKRVAELEASTKGKTKT